MDRFLGFVVIALCLVVMGPYFLAVGACFIALVVWAMADCWWLLILGVLFGAFGGYLNKE